MNIMAYPNRFDELPAIPGGWKETTVPILDRQFQLAVPAHPDAFLDAPATHEANARDGYMPYWAYLWPASRAMARAVCLQQWPTGAAALEIGSGLGLVGLAGWSCGLRVLFSDYDEDAVRTAVFNARRNTFSMAQGRVLDWRNPPHEQVPILLGCDVLYEVRHHVPILDLIESTLEEDGVAWLGDPGRVHAAKFFQRARERGFQLALFNEDAVPVRKLAVGEFRVIVVRKSM